MRNLQKLKFLILLLFLIIAVQSCDKDHAPANMETAQENPTNKPEESTNTDSGTTGTAAIEEIDSEFLAQIKKAGEEYDKNVIWKGYDFSKQSAYFIYRDDSGKPLRGILINPKTKIDGASKISSEDAAGLNAYRYDVDIEKLNEILKAGNDTFDFSYKIDGQDYYAQQYTDEEVKSSLGGAIALAVHEMFHIYQLRWNFVDGTLQDEQNYPITKELLELQLLTTKIAAKMPSVIDKSKIKKYLEMYVAIRSKEMQIDPSPQKFVRNMANAQEHGEGTAKYIETLVGYDVTPNFNRQFDDLQFTDIQTKERMREFFAFGIWYDTGAAVSYMLKNQGVDLETGAEAGKTLFDIAEEFVNLTDTAKTTSLQEAKEEFNWNEIQKEAQRLISL